MHQFNIVLNLSLNLMTFNLYGAYLMKLDIQEIINNKLSEMAQNKTIETQIQTLLENTILSSVSSSFGGYEFKRLIEGKVTEVLGESMKKFDFSAYQGFITDYFNKLINNTLKEDLRNKVEQSFNQVLFTKREIIKLSEIYDIYRDYLLKELNDDKKYDLDNNFYHEISKGEYTTDIKLGRSEFKRFSCDEDSVSFSIWPERETIGTDKETGTLWRVDIEGKKVGEQLAFGNLSDFELLMTNLYFNKTKIEIDVWDDIDTTLGLDY